MSNQPSENAVSPAQPEIVLGTGKFRAYTLPDSSPPSYTTKTATNGVFTGSFTGSAGQTWRIGADYTPTNTAEACPTVADGTWEAVSSPLPPVVNIDLCKCMYSSLICVVAPSVSVEDYGQLFGTVCGLGNSCDGIVADATNGTYGAYSVCNATEQLSFAFNQYYVGQNRASSACNFGGNANTKTASSASGSCSSLLAAAGSDGTGSVGGSVTGGSSSSTSSGAAGHITIPRMETAYIGVAAYILVAGFFGAGMILL